MNISQNLKILFWVHTVEALFDIDKDINDEEVILLADLSEEQKCFLGLKAKDTADECTDYCFVCSSGGSLRVNLQDSLVIQCTTIQDVDNELKQIVRFDVEEYKSYYKVNSIPQHLDILDLDYWTSDGSYEKPVED